MTALAQLSNECHQSIKYDCNFAPFELNEVAFGWWNDKDGNSKYFWSGGNTDTHTCQCGIDANCVETYIKCNCDAAAPVQLSDDGVITDKSILPITRLNFGRTQLDTSSGVHTLGRFECTGQVVVNGMPTSCEDLWRIGHTMSGLYSVMGAEMVESVYCDFNKLPSDTGFEKWIGFADVKSSPAYFYAQRNSSFNQTNLPIPFDIAKVNIGGALDLQTGIFTAARSGTYFFSVSGLANIPASSSGMNFWIGLYLNGNRIGTSYSVEISTASQLKPYSLQSTLNLEAGDQVWVQIWKTGDPTGVYLYDDINHYTHFNGWLLQENISNSLNAMQTMRHDLF
ncbi:uncharacterized protein LOC124202220 [Daphnia pulex]|uniref:uncharacterized protein LOC124202220 n=1 Tax=Daphnia pulex TaxID=6669 RepID=UPI001EDEB24A|nr:uncharacterized protein LOC124202220 [Daphnia pulex]